MTSARHGATEEDRDDCSECAASAQDIERLYRDRAHMVAQTLGHQTADRDIIWDAVQGAFARFASLTATKRAQIARPDAYLVRAGSNLLRDWGRRTRTASRIQALEAATELSHDPVRELEARDTLRRLEQALMRLRPRTRTIFLSHRLDGLSYAEIAARTGLSIKGVEKQMSKAIAMVDRFAGKR